MFRFIARLTVFIHSPKIDRAHMVYSSLMSRAMSGSWREIRTSIRTALFKAELCDIKQRSWKYVSVCRSGVYKIKFHLLDSLMEDIKRLAERSVSGASVYEEFNVFIKKAYQGSFRRRATFMQDTIRLMKQKQRGE